MRFLLIIAVFMTCGCEVKPKEISYGQDACHFCKMIIVDRQHAAELVTDKGKAYKYDAIECMMNHLSDWEEPPIALYLVADYARPGVLIDATNSHFLISRDIPSPMGAFLTAFSNPKKRAKKDSLPDDEHLNWSQLKDRFDLN